MFQFVAIFLVIITSVLDLNSCFPQPKGFTYLADDVRFIRTFAQCLTREDVENFNAVYHARIRFIPCQDGGQCLQINEAGQKICHLPEQKPNVALPHPTSRALPAPPERENGLTFDLPPKPKPVAHRMRPQHVSHSVLAPRYIPPPVEEEDEEDEFYSAEEGDEFEPSPYEIEMGESPFEIDMGQRHRSPFEIDVGPLDRSHLHDVWMYPTLEYPDNVPIQLFR